MTKFQDLCKIYNQSFSEMSDYLDSCVQFIETLMRGLETYIEVPTKRVHYFDRTGAEKPLREAMYLENGVWHFDTAITMCPESAYRLRPANFARCYYPRQTVLLACVMKKITADAFLVGLEGYPRQFTIDTNDKNTKSEFYQFVFNIVEVYYRNIFQIISEYGESPKKIEFKHVENYL